ncbi:hypothetical protein IHE44_0011563 [Lamprotornis superbus]|uniref:ADP-ribosylation factor-like protein 15 n=2 Tax=Neoaves TaxID=3078114 RepID=A0A835TUH5_9PASS|nr:hypothetical protein IHE44_0011563 [Lamprotornis superbus]
MSDELGKKMLPSPLSSDNVKREVGVGRKQTMATGVRDMGAEKWISCGGNEPPSPDLAHSNDLSTAIIREIHGETDPLPRVIMKSSTRSWKESASRPAGRLARFYINLNFVNLNLMSNVSFEIFHKKDQDMSWGLISEETLPQCFRALCCKGPPPPRPEYDLVCIGLSGSGKTSLLSQLCSESPENIVSTTGFSIKAVPFQNAILNVKELGVLIIVLKGADNIRKYWSRYYQGSQGVIFVLDSASSEDDLETARNELHSALQHPQLCTLPFLILANHQDKPAARSVQEIEENCFSSREFHGEDEENKNHLPSGNNNCQDVISVLGGGRGHDDQNSTAKHRKDIGRAATARQTARTGKDMHRQEQARTPTDRRGRAKARMH